MNRFKKLFSKAIKELFLKTLPKGLRSTKNQLV